jgi:type I restriction enzyme S subunit
MSTIRKPLVRFKGFTEDWEERKVGDFLTESKIAGSNGAEANKLTVKLWSKGVVPKSEVYQGSEATQYYIRKAGQFMYGKLDFLNQAFGIVPEELNGYESTLDSPAFDFSENLNSYFFLEYVSRKSFYQYQGMIANGSRKAKRIHSDTFFDMPLILPLKREQDKIAEFIINLDRTIALHQRKLEQQKKIKKAMLQKMFPKNGAKFPQIRFENFNDEWEERKLGEAVKFINGRAYKQHELLDHGKYRVLRVGNFNTNDRWYYSNLELDSSKYANTGDLLYLWATSFGPEIWSEEKVIYHYHIWKLLIEDDSIDKQYLYTWLLTDEERIRQSTNGTTMVHVTKGNMEEREFQFPTEITEQRKIGTFFKELDQAITLHQRKIDQLSLMKKSMLQKMFV